MENINYEIIAVIVVLVFILVSLYLKLFGIGFTFILSVLFLGVIRVLTPTEIIHGFANEQIAVIIMLLLLGDVFRQTSLLDILFDKIFRNTKKPRTFLMKITALVAVLSAFLNNTPLVILLMPYVHKWSKRNKVSASKFLIPLSFAAILGGCATLVGTSTNLVVNSLIEEQTIIPDLEPLGMFEFAYVGVPMIIVGIAYLLLVAYRLLPSNPNIIDAFSEKSREYIVELQIKENSALVGKTIKEAQLRNLEGLYLFEIIRNDNNSIVALPETILQEKDILLFTGDTATIADMVKATPSLRIPSVGMFSRKKRTEVVEIVVSHNSSVIDKTIKSVNFRSKYDATVIAVHRNEEKLSGKIGSFEMKAGDVLLLLSGEEFSPRLKGTSDFYVISKIKKIQRLGVLRSIILAGGTLLIILLSALGVIKLFMGVVLVLTISMMMKITNPKELARNIDYDLALIIVLSLALGTAVQKTGLAEILATFVIKVFAPMGIVGLLSGIYLITGIMAAYITNKAALAVVFPISITMAQSLGYDPIPFALVVSYAAAANFMTPIGYQTNLMVYGPGRYSFKDFMIVGFPLTALYMIVTVLILRYVYF